MSQKQLNLQAVSTYDRLIYKWILDYQVTNIYEISTDKFQKYCFGVCLTLENNPKLIYCICEQNDSNQLDSCAFQIKSYRERVQHNNSFDHVSCIVEIDQEEVICSHYDGSLILYKNFKMRELKNDIKIFEIIKQPNSSNNNNNINDLILNVAYFSNQNQFLLRLEHFDQNTTLLLFQKKRNSESKLQLIVEYKGETSKFIYRKYLKQQQIVAGFIDKYTFGIIQKVQNQQELRLNNIQTFTIPNSIQELLKIDSEKCSLDQFDVTMYNNTFYIICVYKTNNEQILCSFTLNNNFNPDTSITLNTQFSLNAHLGDVQSIFALTEGQNTRFNYDVTVVYKKTVIAYKLYNIQRFDGCELKLKEEDEESVIEYKKYHYQELQQTGQNGVKIGFHLVVSHNKQLKQDIIEYFNVLL